MLRSFFLPWLRRLSAVTTALLLLPVSNFSVLAQATPLTTSESTSCRGTEFLQLKDSEVRSLRSLADRYKISLPVTNTLSDGRIFHNELEKMLNSIVERIKRSDSPPIQQDVQLLQRLYTSKLYPSQNPSPQSAPYLTYLKSYLQALSQLMQQVSPNDIQDLKRLTQQYELSNTISDRLNHREFAVAFNTSLQQLHQKLLTGTVKLTEQDEEKIQSLLDKFELDFATLGLIPVSLTTPTTVSLVDIKLLQDLGKRYGSIPFTFTANQRPSRYEFAAVLNGIMDRINELIASGNVGVNKTDLQILQRLQEEYAAELATLRSRIDALETRSREIESNQFSIGDLAVRRAIAPPVGDIVTSPLSYPSAISLPPVAPTRIPASNSSPLPAIGRPSSTASGSRQPASASTQPSASPPIFTDRSRIHSPGTFNTENYNPIEENPFQRPVNNPLSTFSIDVDTASYSNVRRFISQGQLPPKDAVRIEELINYFPYDYPQPQGNQPFSITTEVATAPWNAKHKLVQIGLKGKQIEKLQPSNLVFLVDVSGSMNEPNKLPLVKQSLCLLVQELSAQDRVTMVVYAGNAGLVLPPTLGNRKDTIMAAIDRLEAGGSTAGGAGIELAYKMAQQNFLPQGNNRVILATDGDFNVGVSSDAELVQLIEQKRDKGVFLTVLGFGTGNYKDSKMEQLANKGNGNYAYIDTLLEARKVLVQDLRSTLFAIAKDVKIQVEFNPAKVQAYRLIGYENRLLRDQDFNDDQKDAGEIGAGHTVTALYEIIPTGIESDVKLPTLDPLRYQRTSTATTSTGGELMQVKLRYKHPKDASSQLISQTVLERNTEGDRHSANLKFSSAVALFGMVLRQSDYKGTADFDTVLQLANQAKGSDRDGYRSEFIRLVERCKTLIARK